MKDDRLTISPSYDPWESIVTREHFGRNILTSIEFTVTNLCNLRCGHCAVGETLTFTEDPNRIPLDLLFKRLDEVPHLQTISITGGEPMMNKEIISSYIVPLLRYAHERGVRTQLNSNLTLELERYEAILPYLDVLHISMNCINSEQFHAMAYVHSPQPVSLGQADKTFQRLLDNTRILSKQGVFVSAETMINQSTVQILVDIHHLVKEIGCKRHEVHPMYASDFARNMTIVPLDELRSAYHRLLDERDPDLWILFGTLPFYACSHKEEDIALIRRMHAADNVTVRNDPDGHNRLNVNIFTGNVIVTDFGDIGPLGNVNVDTLEQCFERWQDHPAFQPYNCYCPQSRCNGPNVLVVDMYYRNQSFVGRRGQSLEPNVTSNTVNG